MKKNPTMFSINNIQLNQPQKSNILYVANEDKRNMWIYYYHHSKSLFIFDPIIPSIETIQLIANISHNNLYFILSACQREKKRNVKLWKKIFPHIQLFVPDKTFLLEETVIGINTLYDFNEDIQFSCAYSAGVHTICMKVHQYLFVGEIFQIYFHNKNKFLESKFLKNFFRTVNNQTIILPSFGPIDIMSNYDEYINPTN